MLLPHELDPLVHLLYFQKIYLIQSRNFFIKNKIIINKN